LWALNKLKLLNHFLTNFFKKAELIVEYERAVYLDATKQTILPRVLAPGIVKTLISMKNTSKIYSIWFYEYTISLLSKFMVWLIGPMLNCYCDENWRCHTCMSWETLQRNSSWFFRTFIPNNLNQHSLLLVTGFLIYVYLFIQVMYILGCVYFFTIG